ncbi:UNVERIFIED_CONTAM: hypothetical protein Sindi_2679300 [Sesamum indicum]
MPQRRIPMGQSKYFYTKTWTKEIDDTFCHYLYYHTLMGRNHSDRMTPDYGSLGTAAQAIRDLTGRSWSLDFFRDKFNLLRLRHEMFTKVLQEPGITWNRQSNRMTGGMAQWRRLIWECSFAKTYFYFGEPKWEKLEIIFGGIVVRLFQGNSNDIDEYEPSDDEPDIVFLEKKQRTEPELEVVDLVSSEDDE